MSLATDLTAISANNKAIIDNSNKAVELNNKLEQTLYGTDTGGKSYYDEFWDGLQNNGKRTAYYYGFYNWSGEIFRPKYNIIPTGSTDSLFRNIKGVPSLPKRLNECGVKFGAYNITGFNDAFYNSDFEETGVLDLSNCKSGISYCFGYSKVRVIEKLVLTACTAAAPYTQTFNGCTDLETLIVEGVINKNSFDVRWSTKLTHESLMSIINALYDYSADTSGTTWTVTIGSENIAKLTEEEQKIARDKGWTLA